MKKPAPMKARAMEEVRPDQTTLVLPGMATG